VSARRDHALLGVLFCFFLSGFAALLYQTAWTRQFAFVFGTSELAVALVLAGYMGGLSLGAWVAGRFAASIRRPVWVYALLELGIALCALGLPLALAGLRALTAWLFADSETQRGADDLGVALFGGVGAFVVLVIPTALMGATLPLLARHAVRNEAEIGRRIGLLYAVNTLGAIFGTLVAGFALLPFLGLSRTVWVGVGVNALIFAVAALLSRRHPAPVAATGRSASDAGPNAKRRNWILPLVLVSGIASFGYEVLWTRLLGQLLGGSVYAFSTMLASFLAGITLGSAVASRFADRRHVAVVGFGLCQLAIAGFGWMAFGLLDALPGWAVALEVPRVGGVHPWDVALCVALLLPSTIAIGATFPFAVKLCARDVADAAPASARVYSWNTVGAIGGALGTGFLLIPAVGFASSFAFFIALNLGLAAVAALVLVPRSRPVLAVALAASVGLAVAPPPSPSNLLRFAPLMRRVLPGKIVFQDAGRSASILVREEAGGLKLTSNGLAEATIATSSSPRFDLTNRWAAALPTLARPEAQSLLVIGLGGGVIVEEVPESILTIDVVELEPAVVEANRVIAPLRRIDPFSDPRIRVIENDARAMLAFSSKRYDGIISQPSHPWTAGASHLYTREFFELVRDHLAPGGVFVQWIGLSFVDEPLLKSLLATLLEAFPHVRAYSPPPHGGLLFVASAEPLPLEVSALRALEDSPESYRRIGILTPEDLFIALELDEEAARELAAGAPLNTDDDNRLQVRGPKILGSKNTVRQQRAFLEAVDPVARLLPDLDAVYTAVRMGQRRPGHPRLALLSQAAGSEAESRMIELATAPKLGRFERIAGLRALAEAGDESGRAYELIALALRPALQGAAKPAVSAEAAALPDPLRAVTDGWQHEGRERELERLEDRLIEVAPGSLLFPAASMLRARWRLAEGSPQRAREALDLLSPLATGRDGGYEEWWLLGRAAAQVGDSPSAVANLERALRLADQRGTLHSKRIRQLRQFVTRLPMLGDDFARQQKFLAKLNRFEAARR